VDSSGTEVAVPAEHATQTWNVLAEGVQAFTRAWEAGPAPDLAAFVGGHSPAIRRLLLIELVKVDLDYRWGRGVEPRRVEDYLAAFPELAEDGPPCDLIYQEFRARKGAGQQVDVEDYLARFPAKAVELGRLLGTEKEYMSASMVVGPQLDSLAAGDTIDDFDLLALLGKGAFARVFLARQRSMQRLVALKASADSGQEPQTLAQLDHPHIVRVYDQRVVAGCGVRLLYMQYVRGGSLQAVLDRVRRDPQAARGGRTLLEVVDQALEERGETPPVGSALRERIASWDWPETVCWLGARLAEALDHAHRRGVLHRDVKPANVLLTAEGAPQLADFNVSFGSKLEGANPSAFFGGSLTYMSPEQLEAFNPAHGRDAGDLDGRSDLYALCLLLWELLAGRRPFRDDQLRGDWAGTLARMTERRRAGVDPADTAALPADLPRGLAEVLLAGLAPDPAQRPESGAALARELELCLRPRARNLLYPPKGGWRALVRRTALLALVLATLAPNAIGGFLNFAYNRSEIVDHVPGAEPVFLNVQAAINGIAFPLGIVLLVVLVWPVLRAVAASSWATWPPAWAWQSGCWPAWHTRFPCALVWECSRRPSSCTSSSRWPCAG
jgi:eukaryotic-like serine/threonine-protein kinase